MADGIIQNEKVERMAEKQGKTTTRNKKLKQNDEQSPAEKAAMQRRAGRKATRSSRTADDPSKEERSEQEAGQRPEDYTG